MRKLIGVLVLVAGCNGGGSDSDPCAFEHRGIGATAQYHHDVECATNPFPSDVLRSGSTLTLPAERFTWTLPRSGDFDQARQYVENVAATYDADGFSLIAPILVSVDYPVDPTTAVNGVSFYRFTGGTPAPDALQFTATYDSNLSSLVLQPYAPLLPATTYGVVVDADLLTVEGGAPATRSRQFGEAMAEASGDLAALITAYGDTDRIAVAFTFTTQSIHGPLLAVRDRIFGVLGSSLTPSFADEFPGIPEGVFASGSPEFSATMVDAGVTGTNIGFIATGSFESFDFRGTDGLAWDTALVTGPSVPPTETLVFRVAFPEGPVPVGGWPLVIYGHGLGGNETDVYEQAQFLGPRGFAVAGISAIEHGLRGDVISFFNWDSIPATRESLRQTTADQLQLLRTLENAQSAGMAPFDDLDLGDVSYYGISLGGIMGSAFLASAPGVDRGLLIVPGGHVSRELFAPGVASNYFYPYISTSSGIDYLAQPQEFADFLRGFVSLVQIGLDAGDPAAWAPTVDLGATPVFMMVSEGDTVVTNETSFALRQAYDIPWLAAPITDAGGVSGAWLYTTADFPELAPYEPHSWFGRSCEAREQAFHWLETQAVELIDPETVSCP